MLKQTLSLALFALSSVSQAAGVPGTASCKEGLKNFPYLKPWAEKLENFQAPIEAGNGDNSLFFVIGGAITGKKAVDLWETSSLTLELKPDQKDAKIETVWLGEAPPSMLLSKKSLVKPGPGNSQVVINKGHSQGSPVALQAEQSLAAFSQEAIKETGATGMWLRVWNLLFSPVELDLLGECTKGACKIKFNDAELKQVSAVSAQYRINEFRTVLQKRIINYQANGDVYAYEGSDKPIAWEEMPINPVLPSNLATHFWKPANRKTFGYEFLDAEPGRHKPVLAVFSRQCEKRGQGPGQFTVCSDIVIYNNHYFDYWARLVYFFPWCDKELVLYYEALDIDQIKGSSIVRMIFGGQFRKSMEVLLDTRLKHLRMLGS